METRTLEWGLAGVAGVLIVALTVATSVMKNDLNEQLVEQRVGEVVEVHDTQIDRSTYGEFGRADVRPASIIVTTTGRFMVEGVWQGLPGEKVQVRTMRGGNVLICRVQAPCALVQN